LRGFAAVLILFTHLELVLPRIGLREFGGGGVDVFFAISGFIMVYTTTNRPVTAVSFMSDRIARIVPLYWLITLAVFTLALLRPSLLQTTTADWGELVQSLLFIPFKKTNDIMAPILFVGWTLNYEMFFYALFALGLCLPGRCTGPIAVVGCLLLLVGSGPLQQTDVGRFYSNPTMIDFAFGIVLGLVYHRLPGIRLSLRIITTVGITIAAVLIVVLPLEFPTAPSLATQGVPAALVVGGGLVLEKSGWAVRSRLCLLLGAVSYSMYLTHVFVTETAQKVAAVIQPDALTTGLFIILTLVAVLMVAVLVHYSFEKPLSNMFRRLLRTRRLNPAMETVQTMEETVQTVEND